MEKPVRKHPRLKQYDYSLPGYYYVTIHIEREAPLLSQIKNPLNPEVILSPQGKIAQRQLMALQNRYPNVIIDKYVIMPTHIHAIIRLTEYQTSDMQLPTLMDVIRTYKSLTTRLCNEMDCASGRKLFQTSFFEKVLRSEQAYQACWLYIDGNPGKWFTNPDDL